MINVHSLSCWRNLVLVAMSIVTATGCNLSDTGPSAYLPSDQYFAVLTLEHHAINLSMVAPYDTVTLHTTSVMGDGSVVPGDVTFSVSDPAISVTNGILKAEQPVTQAVVRATLTHGTITRTDSAIVSVIAGAPTHLRDFGVRIPSGDSAKTGTGFSKKFPLIRESESGTNLSTLLVHVASSNPSVARIKVYGDSVHLDPLQPGRVVLSSATFAFGTVWRDSLVFTIGWPTQFITSSFERFVAGSLTKKLGFVYQDFTIGVGGCVVWETTNTELDLDVQFDDSANVLPPLGTWCANFSLDPTTGGNIAPFRKIPYDGNPENAVISFFSGVRARKFSRPGVFTYRSRLHGTEGRVRVCDERNDTTCAPLRMGGWY